MRVTRNGIVLRLALAAALAATPMTASLAQERGQTGVDQRESQHARSAGSLPVPVSGLATPAGSATGLPLAGTLAIQRFARSGDGVVAVGTLTASYTDPATGAVRTIITNVSVPLDRQLSAGQAPAPAPAVQEDDVPLHGPAVAMQPACDILHLVLGPLDLNLLGLRVQLNQVVLDITAVPGAGNLLGNLLCAIVGLLDGPGPLARLVGLLNELLAILS